MEVTALLELPGVRPGITRPWSISTPQLQFLMPRALEAPTAPRARVAGAVVRVVDRHSTLGITVAPVETPDHTVPLVGVAVAVLPP